MKKTLMLFLVMVLLAGCSQKAKPAEQEVPAPNEPAVQAVEAVTPSPTEAQKETNSFDARTVKAGDQVTGLRIGKVEVHNASDEDYDAAVSFEGEVTVSGTFKHNKDDEFLDHEISFVVDEGAVDLLPKLAHDQRYVWFMLMNHDEAEKAFGAPGTEGKAKITIKNYCINYAHTEVWNTAELVKAEMK